MLLLGGLASLVAIATSPPHAAANPPCASRYTLQNGVVTDNDTKLMWQQSFAANLNPTQAADYCATLSLDGGGFRLPSVFELQTLVDESRTSPLIDDATFPMTPGNRFWSSTTKVDQTGCQTKCTWYVDFGLTAYALANTDEADLPHYVRCVR